MNTYTTIQGDTWDMIAFKVYGEEKYADILMTSNYPYLDYFVFPAGIVLDTPPIVVGNDIEVPEWRESEESEVI